jgi:hypothetical protein
MIKKAVFQALIILLNLSIINWSINPFTSGRVAPAYAAGFAVMIIPPSGSTQANPSLMDGMIKAFKDTGKFDVVSRQEVDNFVKSRVGTGSGAKNLDSVFNEAVELLNKGQKFYNALKVNEAVSTLSDAKSKFKEALPSIDNESDYSRFLGTYFYLAMAYKAKNMDSQAKQELREMIILDPKSKQRKFSTKYYSPQILALYEQVRKDVYKGEFGTIKIKSNPAGAKTYIDGTYVGDTPIESSKIPVGEHFIGVDKQGYEKWSSSKFTVEGANNLEVDLKQGSGSAQGLEIKLVNSSYEIPKTTANILDEMGVSLGGDIFLLWELKTKGKEAVIAGQIYDQRNQEISKAEEAKISDLGQPEAALVELAGKLSAYLNPEGYVMASPQIQQPKEKEGEESQEITKPVVPPDLANNELEGEDAQGEDQNWQSLPPKPPGQSKMWYEKGWVWGVIAGSVLLTVGSLLLFTDVAKSGPSKSTLIINK